MKTAVVTVYIYLARIVPIYPHTGVGGGNCDTTLWCNPCPCSKLRSTVLIMITEDVTYDTENITVLVYS
jgi:hypothetical protein